MTPLITISDIRAVKSISLNTNEVAQLTPYILEAQDFDLRPILGDEFYFYLVENLSVSPIPTDVYNLWNGSTYTWGGQEYTHEGIKPFLIYSSYARYIANSSVIATPTGMVQKVNQFSEHVSEKTIARLVEQARSGSQVYENRFRMFLDRFPSEYPLWLKSCKTNKPYKAGLRFKSIG